MFATTRPIQASVLLFAFLAALAGCGGSASTGSMAPAISANSGTQTLSLSFTGTGPLSNARSAKSFSGTPVTVSFNGKVVATGTLDSSGRLTINVPGVPPGATVTIAAGSTQATAVLSTKAPATIITIQLNSDGTLTVTTNASNNASSPAPDGDDAATEIEDRNGNPEDVDDFNNGALPANLPFTVSTNCTTITLTPSVTKLSRLIFEEKVQDSDGMGRFRFDGPFNTAVTAPIVGASARIHIIVFDQSGKQIVEIKAPINAFTPPVSGAPTPSPCPSVAPMPSPTSST